MYEISSDSDEEWYDRCPKKLEKLRHKYGVSNDEKLNCEEQVETNHVNILKLLDPDVIELLDDGSTSIVSNALDTSNNDISARPRKSKRKTDTNLLLDPDVIELLDGGSTSIASNALDTSTNDISARPRKSKRKTDTDLLLDPETLPKKGAKRGRSRGRGRGSLSSPPSAPKRGRGRGKAAKKSKSRGKRWSSDLEEPVYDIPTVNIVTPSPRRSGRSQRRGSQQNTSNLPPFITYSVGNTDEYPDASDNLVLFGDKKTTSEPVVIDLDEDLNNEELSVKVLWQHLDVVKFNIRRHQKLTQIFDHFVKEKGVSRDRLLFTYSCGNRDRVLRPDDTPDLIDYNIAKFIEGGVVNKQITLVKNESPQKKGFILKFQFQNKKKPLELSVGKDEKLQIAMVKCAEHFEVPISNLVFEFDGESIPGTKIPCDLDMESGDCIDVKIVNVNK